MSNDGVNRVVEKNFEKAKEEFLAKEKERYSNSLKKISISVPKNIGF